MVQRARELLESQHVEDLSTDQDVVLASDMLSKFWGGLTGTEDHMPESVDVSPGEYDLPTGSVSDVRRFPTPETPVDQGRVSGLAARSTTAWERFSEKHRQGSHLARSLDQDGFGMAVLDRLATFQNEGQW